MCPLAARERAEDISRNTLRGYKSHIERLYLPAVGQVPLDRLRTRHLDAVFDGIRDENERIAAARASEDPEVRKSVAGRRATGAATMARIRATIRSALSDAERDHLIAFNPAKTVRLPAADRPLPRVWTAEPVTAFWERYGEATKGMTVTRHKLDAWLSLAARPFPMMVWVPAQTGAFLDHVADGRLYAMWRLVAFTGLRRGEMAGLRWPDIDLAQGELHIEIQLVQLGWEVDEDTPKTEASAAPVPIDKQAVALLKARRKAQMTDQAAMGPDWVKSGRVFTQLSGAALHAARITTMFERAAFDAKLPPIRLHDLRHGAATLAHAAGADMKAIQVMLRHAHYSITADTYTTVLQETQAALAEGIGAVVPRLRSKSDPSETRAPISLPYPAPDPRESASWP